MEDVNPTLSLRSPRYNVTSFADEELPCHTALVAAAASTAMIKFNSLEDGKRERENARTRTRECGGGGGGGGVKKRKRTFFNAQ